MAEEGKYLWGSDYSVAVYTNWESGQPDNFDNAEDCVVVVGRQAMKWNDIPCDWTDSTYTVCQKAA